MPVYPFGGEKAFAINLVVDCDQMVCRVLTAAYGEPSGRSILERKLFTKLKIGALAATCALFVLATPAFANNDGTENGNGCINNCGHQNGNGVPLPIAGAGILALAVGGFVIRRRMRKTDTN